MKTTNQFPKTVAGITFTETGILIENHINMIQQYVEN